MTLANTSHDVGALYRPKEGVQVSQRTAMAGLPVVRVVQDQSGKGSAGNFISVSTGEEWEELAGTPLAIREGHIKWPTPFQGAGQGPECWSTDTVQGAPGAKYAGQFCSECEFFLNGCTPQFAVVFLLLPERRQVLLTLTRGMTQVVGELLQSDTVRSRHVRLFTRKVRGRLGSWYTVAVDRDMPALDPELQIAVEQFFRSRYVSGASLPSGMANPAGSQGRDAPDYVDPATGEITAPSAPSDSRPAMAGHDDQDDQDLQNDDDQDVPQDNWDLQNDLPF